MVRPVITIAACSVAGIASAAPLVFTIDPSQSGTTGALTLGAASAGTLIGDFDPVANPDGTQTRPGLFGGSGNQPIPLVLDLSAGTELDLSPTGGFTLDPDTAGGVFSISGLSLDLLNGSPIASTLELTLLYETFRTINPGGFYPGGIPLPLSIEAGELATLTISQTAEASGILVASGDGFTFAAAVAVEVDLVGSTLGGTPLEPAPIALTLPVAGSLMLNADGSSDVSLAIDLAAFDEMLDTSALPALPSIPFELPTIGGDFASVVFNLAVESLSISGSGAVDIVASAGPAGCNEADLATPFGVLDLGDISAFVAGFTSASPIADLDGNGIYDLGDIQRFVNAFLAGCP